jgi:hypothetical protein
MKTNIISKIFTGNKNIIRIAAIAAVAAAAVFGVQQSAPKADADNLQYVKLCRYFSPVRSDFFSTTSTANYSAYNCAQYPNYGMDVMANEMLLSPNQPQPPNTVAIYNWWDGSQDNRLMRSDVWSCATPGVSRVGNWTCVRKEGFAFKTAQANAGACGPTKPLYTSFSSTNTDYAAFPAFDEPNIYSRQYLLGHAAVWFC